MRPQTPLDVCAEIARGQASGTLAAIGKTRAARLAQRLERCGEALAELAGEDENISAKEEREWAGS